jgi:hypothetical protein
MAARCQAGGDALILTLVERFIALIAENAKLEEGLARVVAKLGEPPTPSVPSRPT